MSCKGKILLITACVLILGLVVRKGWFPGKPFDSVAWQDPEEVKKGVRLEMADRLLARGKLLGKTRAEVLDFLGQPTETSYFGSWDLVYWLGFERGFFSIDS